MTGSALVEVASGRIIRQFPQRVGAFLPDSRRIMCFNGISVTHVDVETGKDLMPQFGHYLSVNCLAFARDGRSLLSGDRSGAMKLWDLSKREARTYNTVPQVQSVAFSPDGLRALTSHPAYTPESPMCLWELHTGRLLRPLEKTSQPGSFSPDGKLVLYNNTQPDSVGRLWDTERGTDVRWFKKPDQGPGPVRLLGFLPDGDRAYTVHEDGLWLWDVATSKSVRPLPIPRVRSLQFATDGKRLFTGHEDGSVKRWDLSGKELQSFTFYRFNTGMVHCMALSPDGKFLLSGDSERRIVLWDPDSGKKVREWQHRASFRQLLFAPDSRHLAMANDDGTIYILRLAPPPAKAGQ
jgi:WD40 repeat protein